VLHPSIEKKERTRKKSINELYQSEIIYNGKLDSLISVFIAPLRESNLLSEAPINRLDAFFSDIENIKLINHFILQKFKLRIEEWEANPTIGDVLSETVILFILSLLFLILLRFLFCVFILNL